MLASYLAAAETLDIEPEQIVVFAKDGAGMEAGRAGHFCYLVRVERPGHDGMPAPTRPFLGADVVVPELTTLLR